MSDITWQKNGSGAWTVKADWSGGVEPGAADDVTLTSAAHDTITFATTDTVAGLTSTDDILWITTGSLSVSGDVGLAGGFHDTGGTLALLGATNSMAGGINIGHGDVTLGNGDSLTLGGFTDLGSATNTYGARIYGAGTMVTTGTLDIVEDGGYTEAVFGAGLVWQNTGRVNDAGIVSPGYIAGNAFSIMNLAHAVFNFTTDVACLMDGVVTIDGQQELATSSFNNAGVIEKTGGTGTTTFYCSLQDTGTIEVNTGTIEMLGGGVIGGLVEGAGTLRLSDSDFTLSAGLKIKGTLTCDTQVDQTGAVTLGGGTIAGLLNVDDLYNIDNNAAVAQGTAGSAIIVTAQGTLAATGTGVTTISVAVADNGLILAESGKLLLAGAVAGTGGIEIGNSATLKVASVLQSGIIVTLGTSSDLQIGDLPDFGATISGFAAGNTLDLLALTVTSATASSDGTLTLLNSAGTVGTLLLAGDLSADVFTTQKDNNGGTLLEISTAGGARPKMAFIAAGAAGQRAADAFGSHPLAADWFTRDDFRPGAETMRPLAFGVLPELHAADSFAGGAFNLSGTYAAAGVTFAAPSGDLIRAFG